MKITQVRNATIIVEYNETKFLIDPWLGPKDYMEGFESALNSQIRQPRVELPFEIEKTVDVDAVILTHFHPDHFDEYAVNALNKDIKFFVQSQKDLEIIKSYGFKNLEVMTQQGIDYKNIKLYKTDCQHGKREIIKPLCESIGMPYDAMGVVFKSNNEKTLYVAGDTIWCDEVSEAIDKFEPEIIVVNACAATVINGERLIMNIDDVRQVIKKAPKSTIIASHMDTVSHLTVTRKDLEEFREKESVKNLLIPDDGEVLNF
ncbi:TPA: MBL fold metallo-hydrolase [Candidatus Galligastranaerophilus intestinavium]|uniref:MBL fold metallo-hydrolase n=1 Tax=Candidatus Galligastranaerophilus intestinavium TaxID=2840836 RepID=A0A9D1FKA5_9BACT|nr:MBL fold metallo-hydrolase [Candidatus Galligastranaerophilus intestinavium]